jgi:hypothetical protein
MRLWLETWFAKAALDSRDSAALETWDYEDVHPKLDFKKR